MKKLSELSTLCGIQACAVMYPPGGNQPLEVYPSVEEAKALIDKLRNGSETAKTRNMNDQEGFLRQLNDKTKTQLHKRKVETRETLVKFFMREALAGRWTLDDVVDRDEIEELYRQINSKKKEIEKRITMLRAHNSASINLKLPIPMRSEILKINAEQASPPLVAQSAEEMDKSALDGAVVALDGNSWFSPEMMNPNDYMFYGDGVYA